MTAEEKARYAKELWRWGQDHQQERKNVLYLEDRMYAVKLEGLGFVAIVEATSMFEAVKKVEHDALHYHAEKSTAAADLSEYSDKLWKAAYERGRNERPRGEYFEPKEGNAPK